MWQQLWEVPKLPSLIKVGTVGKVSVHHSSASDQLHSSCTPCQVVPSLQLSITNIYLAAIVGNAKATISYNYWHHRWVFTILFSAVPGFWGNSPVRIPVECLLKSVIKHVKFTRFSPAAGMVNSSTHGVKHLITWWYSMAKLITLNQ